VKRKIGSVFFCCGGLALLQGFLTKTGVQAWCFCGAFVVECVADAVLLQPSFAVRKIGHLFQLYFC
jgi:hypothetical protein